MPSPRVPRRWAAAIAEQARQLAQAAARIEGLCLEDQPSIVTLRAQGKMVRKFERGLSSVLYNLPS